MRLSRHQKEVLTRIRKHPVLVTLLPEGRSYSLADGTPIHARTAEAFIGRGVLVPSQDGLFDDESQTYIVAEGV